MSSLPIAYRNRISVPKLVVLALALLAPIGSGNAFAQNAPAAAHPATGKEIHIAAAADLQTALPAIAQRYERETGVKLVASFGSSGTLATQILNGAPFDLFLGADYTFPEKIVAANLADAKAPTAYAKGMLVVWARKDSPLQPISVDSLSDARVKTIAIADQLHAPYGRAASAALTRLKIYDQLKPKLVVGENVAQTAQFVESGNADIGLISLTIASSEHFKELGTYVVVPDVYPEIRQCAVIMLKSQHRTEAHAFLDWLLSSAVQSNLPKLGLNAVR